MRCIDPDLIQMYIDKEVTLEEELMIKDHLKQCQACATRFNNQLQMVTQVKDTINLITNETIEIPEFTIPEKQKKRHANINRRLIYGVAAACIIILILITFHTNNRVDENSEYFMQLVEYEYDANRTLSEQELVIEFIDPNGNLTEYFLE